MTYYDCIRDVDRIEPNAYEVEDKIRWIREIEGQVWTDLFLMQPIGFHVDNMLELYRQELSIPAPYNKVYRRYLQAMIHYANGEYERYANSMAMFNDAWADLNIWFGQDYDASDFHRNPVVEGTIDFSVLEEQEEERGETRTAVTAFLAIKLLDIPERCAFVGGQFIAELRELLGVEFEVEVRTRYKRLWKGTVQDGKTVFLPMVIAPPGGDELYALIGDDVIYIKNRGVQATSPWPVAHFHGRMMTPDAEHQDWRKVHVQPTMIFPTETFELADQNELR